jgi:hypothetical protein
VTPVGVFEDAEVARQVRDLITATARPPVE